MHNTLTCVSMTLFQPPGASSSVLQSRDSSKSYSVMTYLYTGSMKKFMNTGVSLWPLRHCCYLAFCSRRTLYNPVGKNLVGTQIYNGVQLIINVGRLKPLYHSRLCLLVHCRQLGLQHRDFELVKKGQELKEKEDLIERR